MLELSVTGTTVLLLRKWAQQGRITQLQIFRRGSNGLTIMDNTFNGALGVLYPSDPTSPLSVQALGASGNNVAVTECGNNYGVNAAQLDATCASAGQLNGSPAEVGRGP